MTPDELDAELSRLWGFDGKVATGGDRGVGAFVRELRYYALFWPVVASVARAREWERSKGLSSRERRTFPELVAMAGIAVRRRYPLRPRRSG